MINRKGSTMKHVHLIFLLGLFMTGTTTFAETEEMDFLEGFVKGTYVLIGKHLESNETYLGEILLSDSETGLSVTRTIAGIQTQGTATIEQTSHTQTPVLRVQFSEDGREFEETCLIASDLNNYARITCHLYIPGQTTQNPGMEAWFIKPPKS